MSLDPDELAIREAFARRRPATVPPALLARVAAVPGEVRPLRPMPVRLALGVAPWVAVAAAGFVLAFGPRFVASLAGPATGAPSDTAPAWTPATTGGLGDIGVFGLPWVVLLPVIAALAIAWTTWRIRAGLPVTPSRRGTWEAVSARRDRSVREFLAYTVPTLGCLFLVMGAESWNPVVDGSLGAPGPDVSEVRSDGTWLFRDPSLDSATCHSVPCPGPRWVYRVRPGQPYTYVASVRNNSVVPITLLGRLDRPDVQGPTGLGLLRDPANLSADPANVEPFRPVTVQPGQVLALVIVESGRACADPASPLAARNGPPFAAPDPPAIVYEAFGWRRVGIAHPHVEITVAGCDTAS